MFTISHKVLTLSTAGHPCYPHTPGQTDDSVSTGIRYYQFILELVL